MIANWPIALLNIRYVQFYLSLPSYKISSVSIDGYETESTDCCVVGLMLVKHVFCSGTEENDDGDIDVNDDDDDDNAFEGLDPLQLIEMIIFGH